MTTLQTPTTADIAANLRDQLESSLAQTIPFLPKAALDVIAKVMAGVFVLLWRFSAFVFLQLFVSQASYLPVTMNGRTFIPLVEWGKLFGLGEPRPASRSVQATTLPVTLQEGSLPAGSQAIHSPSGVLYTSIGAVPLDAATVVVKWRAASDQTGTKGLGAIGNRQVGDTLTLVSPLPNVGRDATVTGTVNAGEEGESWPAYRARILEFASARPQGGAFADYRLWSREIPGVQQAYPYTGLPGEVDVYIEVPATDDPDGIPDAPFLVAVFEYLDVKRPANAGVNALAITRLGFTVHISGVALPGGGDLAALQDDIEGALDAYYRAAEPFIVGLSVLPRRDRLLLTSITGIIDELVNAAGGTWGGATQYLGGPETPVYTLDDGERSKLVSVSFVP